MPFCYKLFNKQRRGCTYNFKAEKNGKIVLFDHKTRFSFMGYRRINRYFFPAGLERKMMAMKKKYCIPLCTIEPGETVVEVGANVGEFTLMAAQQAAKVFSFEPDPKCFDCLRENTQNLTNVEVVNQAASKANTSETFYLSSEDADSSLIQPKIYSEKIVIRTLRLDSWMEFKGLSTVDFLKIEAEGAEMEVLEGLGDAISQVQKVSVDGGPERYGEPTSHEVDLFLQSKGFNTSVVEYHVYAWRGDNIK